MKKLLLLITLITLPPTTLADGINTKAAYGHALSSVVIQFFLATILFYILSFGLWGKARDTAIKNGRWVGAIFSAASLATSSANYYQSQAEHYYAAVLGVIGWFVIGFVVGYAWRKFNKIELIESTSTINDTDYLRAEEEFESELRDKGLWARCFAEADGNQVIARARYIKTRAIRISQNSLVDKKEVVVDTKKEVVVGTKKEVVVDTKKERSDYDEKYSNYSAKFMIENNFFSIKEYKHIKYWLLKNNDAAIRLNENVYVYFNEIDCKKSIDSQKLVDRTKIVLKVSSSN